MNDNDKKDRIARIQLTLIILASRSTLSTKILESAGSRIMTAVCNLAYPGRCYKELAHEVTHHATNLIKDTASEVLEELASVDLKTLKKDAGIG